MGTSSASTWPKSRLFVELPSARSARPLGLRRTGGSCLPVQRFLTDVVVHPPWECRFSSKVALDTFPDRTSRFSRVKFPCMLGVFDRAEPDEFRPSIIGDVARTNTTLKLCLMQFLTLLGRDVEIVIKTAPRSRRQGHLRVVAVA